MLAARCCGFRGPNSGTVSFPPGWLSCVDGVGGISYILRVRRSLAICCTFILVVCGAPVAVGEAASYSDRTLRTTFRIAYKRYQADVGRAARVLRLPAALSTQATLMRVHALISREEIKGEQASSANGRVARSLAIQGFTEGAAYAKALVAYAGAVERNDVSAQHRLTDQVLSHGIAATEFLRAAERKLG